FLRMTIALPSRVWRQLGYEPESQNFDNQHEATSNTRQIKFWKLPIGEDFGNPFATGETVPGNTYWAAEMSTVAEEYSQDVEDSNEWDNGGSRRYWRPKFEGEPFTIDMTGGG